MKRMQRKGGRRREAVTRKPYPGAAEQTAQLVEHRGDPEDDAPDFETPDFADQMHGEQEDEDAEAQARDALEDRRLLLAGLKTGEEHLLVHVGEYTIEIELNDDDEAYALRLSHEAMSDEETQEMAPHLESLCEQEALEDMLIVVSPTCWEERHDAEKRLLALINQARAAAGTE